MKYLVTLFFLFIYNLTLLAQATQQKNDSVFQIVVNYLNSQEAAQIYPLVNQDFQKAISLDNFIAASKQLYPMGKMQAKLESYRNGLNKYKLRFTQDSLSMSIGLDSSGKIAALFFAPYFDENKKKSHVFTNNSLVTTLDKIVDSATRPYAILDFHDAVSIGILMNGKKYFYDYGETVRGNKIIPNQHTIYEIGSITKTFTATLLADAVNQGKIKLDDPVNKYLPDSIPSLEYQGEKVTLKTLTNHTSGIPRMPSNFGETVQDQLNPYKSYGIKQVYDFYKSLKLIRKPGTKYEYSNIGMATVGIILEHLYQKDYEALVTEKILKPLSMSETMQFIRPLDSGRVATGYGNQGKYNGPWDMQAFAPAGSLRSTTSDMLRYAQANIEVLNTPLSKDIQLTHAITLKEPTVGLGWHFKNIGGQEYVWHNGGTGGYRADLYVNPKKQFAIIVLSNSAADALIAMDGIAPNIIGKLFNESK